MIEKEFRALLPVWAVCAAGLLASALNLPSPIRNTGTGVYILSCAALGALAFGHEYSHRTMGSLLAQPIARRRVYLVKLGVLAILLFALRAILFVVPFPLRGSAFEPLIVALPLLAALCLAPWLTLVTRSPLAGAMFSLSLASVVLLIAERVATGGYGFTDDVNLFKIALIRWLMLALCAAGAVLGWRAFARLEAIEGRGRPLFDYLPLRPAAGRTRGIRLRRPFWRLVGKELRLQQLTLLIAGLFVLAYLAIVVRRDPLTDRTSAVVVISATHVIIVSLLIGSLASAEERHLGTIDWQLLLPVSSLRQWIVKVGTAIGLMLLLAVALPLALAWLFPAAPGPIVLRALPNPSITAALGTAGVCVSLYVSSLSSSGLRALLGTVPAVLGSITVIRLAGEALRDAIPLGWRYHAGQLTAADRADMLLVAVTLVLPGLLYFGLSNHRTTDRRGVGLTWQSAYIGLGLTFIAVVAETLAL
jgi:hypothetical protein